MRGFATGWGTIAILTGILGVAPAVATTLRVPVDYGTIQGAIDAASDGDRIDVEPGVYFETLDFSGKAIEVIGTAGPESTVIDGSQQGSVVTFQSGETASSIIRGFTLRGGIGSVLETVRYGGGILCRTASPTIRGNVVEGNVADYGGGITCWEGAAPLIEENTITGNHAEIDGGGIHTNTGSSPIIRANVISDNFAVWSGGGIATYYDSAPLVSENAISLNQSYFGLGAGIYCLQNNLTNVVDNDITLNRAYRGGGIGCLYSNPLIAGNRIMRNAGGANDGGGNPPGGPGIYCAESSPRIESNIISENTGAAGGGIYMLSSSPEILANVISSNRAGRDRVGGGIYCIGSSPRIVNCTITKNSAPGAYRRGGGGIMCDGGSSPTIIHSTISDNFAGEGGTGISLSGPITITIRNSIVWGNRGPDDDVFTDFDAEAEIFHSNIEGGWSGPGADNIDADPRFVDLQNDDFQLTIGSPCVDAADNTLLDLPEFDIEGDPRILNGDADPEAVVDMGADELRPEIAVRYGRVRAAGGELVSTLRINGEDGDARRVLRLTARDPMSIDMIAPPAGPVTARFCVYAWQDEPDLSTLTKQPYGLGVTGFPTFLAGGPDNLPFRVWNNLGHDRKLGVPDLPSIAAPSHLVDLPHGVGFPTKITLQGFIEDLGSTADGPVSITNAIVLEVVP